MTLPEFHSSAHWTYWLDKRWGDPPLFLGKGWGDFSFSDEILQGLGFCGLEAFQKETLNILQEAEAPKHPHPTPQWHSGTPNPEVQERGEPHKFQI